MIQLLSSYLEQGYNNRNLKQTIVSLQQDTSQVESRIKKITQVVDSIILDQNQHISLFEHSQRAEKKQRTINSYLQKDSQTLKQQIECLEKEQSYIDVLIVFSQKYLSVNRENPIQLQTQTKQIRRLIDQFADSHSFTGQENEQQQIEGKIIDKLEFYYSKLQQTLKTHLKNLVSIDPSSNAFKIRFKQISSNQQLLDQKILAHYADVLFLSLLQYQISTKNYNIMIPKIQKGLNSNLLEIEYQRNLITFEREYAFQFFDSIILALQATQNIYRMIGNCLQIKDNKVFLANKKDQSLTKVRNQIQYIIPYFSLEKRRTLLQKLSTSKEQQASRILGQQQVKENQNSIIQDIKTSDLLVKLKLKGQDGDMLATTLKILAKKVLKSRKDQQMVLGYLQMIEKSRTTLNLGFFIANQLIEKLQEQDGTYYEFIVELLKCRQNIRDKIHHPVQGQYKLF